MKKIYLAYIISVLFISEIFGQIENLKTHTQMNLDCKKCHICDTPTKANPCLILCPRNKSEVVRHSPDEGPDMIVIHKIQNEENLYGPSNFSHRLHSEMSLMSGGCSICHHFNPPGKIVKCSNCHETNRIRENLSTPDLKAAFHRQCMGCHKTWEKESKCESCHQLNSKENETVTTTSAKNVHPKIEIPVRIIYETESEEGSVVTFFHNDHGSLFGNECSDCHTEESCAKCHSETKDESINLDEHERCSSCHDTEDNCNKCHKDVITEPFKHKTIAGFSLNEHHNNLACISCHKSKNTFTGIKGNCGTCHLDSEGYFDHTITGFELDDIHIEFYCENCHNPNNFKKKPTCDECHDEDIYYPDSSPGEKL